MLTKVLHRVHSGFYHHHQVPKDETETNQATTTCTTANDKNSKIWEEINTKIHDQIAKNLNNQQGVPFDISEFDIDKWVELMDKDIMKMLAVLKALCHAISADCLLIEAARAHAVNEHWAWRMADKFACPFKSAR